MTTTHAALWCIRLITGRLPDSGEIFLRTLSKLLYKNKKLFRKSFPEENFLFNLLSAGANPATHHSPFHLFSLLPRLPHHK